MGKQEEIRAGLAERIYRMAPGWQAGYEYIPFQDAPPIVREQYLRKADEWCAYLHSMGVVIKVGEIRELQRAAANSPAYVADRIGVSWERSAPIFGDFMKAGYVSVEPLIKEE